MTEFMLTTSDNPYNPFTHFPEWNEWDTSHGYHTNALLARVAFTSDELSDADQELSIIQAMDEIIKENVTGPYIKVTRSSKFGDPED